MFLTEQRESVFLIIAYYAQKDTKNYTAPIKQAVKAVKKYKRLYTRLSSTFDLLHFSLKKGLTTT